MRLKAISLLTPLATTFDSAFKASSVSSCNNAAASQRQVPRD